MRKIVTLGLSIVLLVAAIVFNILRDDESNVKQQSECDHRVFTQVTKIELADDALAHEEEHANGGDDDELVDTD